MLKMLPIEIISPQNLDLTDNVVIVFHLLFSFFKFYAITCYFGKLQVGLSDCELNFQ